LFVGVSTKENGGGKKFTRGKFNYRDKLFELIHLLSLCYVIGKKDTILNGIPDWLYSNTPDLNGDTLAFSTNGGYLSFLSFNISNVQKYE
jgi:hypothetical protein